MNTLFGDLANSHRLLLVATQAASNKRTIAPKKKTDHPSAKPVFSGQVWVRKEEHARGVSMILEKCWARWWVTPCFFWSEGLSGFLLHSPTASSCPFLQDGHASVAPDRTARFVSGFGTKAEALEVPSGSFYSQGRLFKSHPEPLLLRIQLICCPTHSW